MASSQLEILAPEYNELTFTDIFSSPESFVAFYTDLGQVDEEISSDFLNKLWFMIYSRYGNDPISGADIYQWQIRLLQKINGYAPTYIKKAAIQKALRALTEDDMREGYKSIFNHAINPSKAPSTDNTNELPFISDQNVNKTKKNKVDGYLTLWEVLRSNVLDEFISKFSSLFSKIASTSDRIMYISGVE